MWPFKKKVQSKGRRAYAGADISRLVADWVAQGTSQDAEVRASLPRLRNRSRQLGRDNDHARQFFRTVQNNVIGEGIKFQAQVRQIRGDKLDLRTNEAIESKWDEWKRKENCHTAGKLHFEDLERLVIKAIFESGEVIVRFVYQNMGTMKTRLALEVLESDLLDDNYNAVNDNGNVIRMGVEMNQWQRPVAYWFFTKHPGDYGSVPDYAQGVRRIRVPAEDILHLFPTERPNQTRGIPAMASAILRLRHMQGYEESEVVAARASASIMGFIESPEEELSIQDDVDAGQSVTEFEPGVFKKLNPGEKVTVPTVSRPGGQFDPFMRLMLRGVASGVGASYETISRDYSQTNYSSTRQALLEDRDNWRVLQKWIIRNFHQAVYEKWIDLAVLSGDLSLKNYELSPRFYHSAKWLPRGWSWIDPLKEVQAYKEAVRSGFKTQSEVISELGGDYEEFMLQRSREVELADEYELIFDSNPADVSANGIQQPSPEDVNAEDSSTVSTPATAE